VFASVWVCADFAGAFIAITHIFRLWLPTNYSTNNILDCDVEGNLENLGIVWVCRLQFFRVVAAGFQGLLLLFVGWRDKKFPRNKDMWVEACFCVVGKR